MKILITVFALPALGFASGSSMLLLACLVAAIVIAGGGFCYLLITRPEVAPRYKRGDDGVEFGFERLPERSRGDDHDSDAAGQGRAQRDDQS